MNREEFLDLIDGFEESPFVIVFDGRTSELLTFVKALSDSVKVLSNGKPAIYQYSKIESLSFDISSLDSAPKVLEQTDNTINITDNLSAGFWVSEYEAARKIINYNGLLMKDRRDDIKARVRNTDIAKAWSRIDSMYNDAIKNHSLKQKADRIISELDMLPECAEVMMFTGSVFAQLEEYDNAAEEFYNGADYYNAACCAKLNKDDKYALYCLKGFVESEGFIDHTAISALFHLLCKYKDGAYCVNALGDLNFDELNTQCVDYIYYGLLMLYKEYVNKFNALGAPKGNRSEDISMLINRIAELSSSEEIKKAILSSVPSITEYEKDNKEMLEEDNQELTGTITGFFKYENNGYGYISAKNNPQLYFNIRQVEDEKLRGMLWNGDVSKASVYFRFGVGLQGRKAADHIRAREDFSGLTTIRNGMIVENGSFDKNGNRYGIISCDDKDHLFRDEAIIDPVLKAYIDNVFAVRNINVRFMGKKNKGNNIALKVWLDDVEEKELIEEYSRYADRNEYDRFIEQKYKIEHGGFSSTCPFEYAPLPVWKDKVDEPIPKPVDNVNEVFVYEPDVSKKDPYHGLGVNELLKYGTQYLTKDKDLEKAEKCFLSVLGKKPEHSNINTAVSNLITIYKQEERTDDALSILEKYQNIIEQEKYYNHLIDIYDKTKRYDDLIKLLTKVIPNAGKSKPHRIKQLITCYIKTNNAEAAIKKLKNYSDSIDKLSYNNLYFSALELLGDFSKSEAFLKNLVASSFKIEHKLNYMNKLAILYQKNGKALEAINAYEQWKKYYVSNRSSISMNTAIAAISKVEVTVDRNLCVLYYNSNKVEEAKVLARNLLRKNSEDRIAQQILDGTYISVENYSAAISNYNYDEEYAQFESADDSIPKLLEWMLNNVDYERLFFNQDILKRIEENRRYVGDATQARSDIDNIMKVNIKSSISDQSNTLMALSKIIKQFVESGQKDDYFTQKKLNQFLGKSLRYKADSDIQSSYKNRDSSRYFYFLSLRYLSRSEDINSFYHAINMLYVSYFLSDNELSAAVSKNEYDRELHITPPDYVDGVISVIELMVCTFDLDISYHHSKLGSMNIVRKIIDEIFTNERLKKTFIECMFNLAPDISLDCQTADKFFAEWKKAKGKYNMLKNDLQQYINHAANNIQEPEKLNMYMNKIRNFSAEKFLNKTDIDSLQAILSIFNLFHKLNELYNIGDREDTLDKVIDHCDKLESSIRETPTEFSYEKMLEVVIVLKGKAVKLKHDMYRESKPRLVVYQEDTSFYKDDHNQVKVTIYIENKGNVQKAEISNIHINGKDNNIEIMGNPEHTFTNVHGNGKDEYIVTVSFTEKEKERKLFDVNFSFDYSYYDGAGEQIKEHFNDVFQINLSNMDSFVKIDNKYSSYIEGGAVESDEMFFGREKEIDNIVKSLDLGDGNVLSHRGIYLYGQKRAGKSSIMAHLAKRIEEAYPDKYLIINLGSLGSNSINDGWLKAILIGKLEDVIEDKYPDIYDELEDSIGFLKVVHSIDNNHDTADFDIMLNKIERMLPDKVIMIFVDEFTYIYESIKKNECDDAFPHFWKALLQNHNICSIVIGQDSMKNFVEEYANDFACMKDMFVSYLDESGSKKMISDPIRDNGKSRFEEDAVDLIYQLTAGSAYLIMILCSQLVDYMNERGTARVTKTTVEMFVRKWLFNTADNRDPITDFHFDAQLNDPCSFENPEQIKQDNKLILTYIANHCNLNNQIRIDDIDCVNKLSERTAEYQSSLISQLIKRKVLIQDGEYCKIWVDLLRRYLKEGR